MTKPRPNPLHNLPSRRKRANEWIDQMRKRDQINGQIARKWDKLFELRDELKFADGENAAKIQLLMEQIQSEINELRRKNVA